MPKPRTPFQQQCDLMIEQSIAEREARGEGPFAEHADDDAVRFGGPVTSGMLMTALNECAYDDVVAHNFFDVNKLAKIINSWLTPVDSK